MQGNYAIVNAHLLSFEERFRYVQYNVVDVVLGILTLQFQRKTPLRKAAIVHQPQVV